MTRPAGKPVAAGRKALRADPPFKKFLSRRRGAPTPAEHLAQLEGVVLSAVRFQRALSDSIGGHPGLMSMMGGGLSDLLDSIAALRESEAKVSYLDVAQLLARAGELGASAEGMPRTRSMPLAALPFGPTPILAIGLGAFDGEISPEDVLRMINEIDRILRELWEQLDEDERRRILEYILDIYSAIRAIRIHGLTPEDLARLNEAMRNLFEFLKYFSGGRYLSTVFQRLMTVMLRFAQGAAGAAESAANSWILALLGRLLFYLAWFLLWCKIGNWLWSHHVAGSTQTYTDWWGDRFYEFYKSVAGYGCDELLEEWHKADRALRDAEAAGAGIGELTNAAIDAESWAKVLLDHCPDLSIKNVVRARIDYYEGIVKRFDDLIGGH